MKRFNSTDIHYVNVNITMKQHCVNVNYFHIHGCIFALHFRNKIGMESVSFSFLGPIL